MDMTNALVRLLDEHLPTTPDRETAIEDTGADWVDVLGPGGHYYRITVTVLDPDPALATATSVELLMCENCRDSVAYDASDGTWVGSDGEVCCPESDRPHGPAVPDDDEDPDPALATTASAESVTAKRHTTIHEAADGSYHGGPFEVCTDCNPGGPDA